jgi:hypothetical protein
MGWGWLWLPMNCFHFVILSHVDDTNIYQCISNAVIHFLRVDLPTAPHDIYKLNKNVLLSFHFLRQFQQLKQCNILQQQSSVARIITSPKGFKISCLRLAKVEKKKMEEQSR